ncbi:hypothetical protein CO613_08070 [Lysobacteraceae bacterium NML07-0707]|nr:hypothetical protein CO613_08070 [Xanthomonadaceae bacterium NML07-0707]
MNKFDDITQRAAQVASEVGSRAADFAADMGQRASRVGHKAADFASSMGGRASNLGGGLKNQLPDAAIKWLETGAALAAVKTGSKVAGKFVRRHPVLMTAAAVGVGLAWYAQRRHARKKAEQTAIEGHWRHLQIERDEHAEDTGA